VNIKLDENLPLLLAESLRLLGHDVDTVADEGLKGQDDGTVWDHAQRAERFLITQDLDFSDVRKFEPGSHYGLLLVRLATPGRAHLLQRLETVFQQESVASWSRCFVVVTDRKVRIRRPK
jgi:predicted nuclease of predicted toxin-antitoxin system